MSEEIQHHTGSNLSLLHSPHCTYRMILLHPATPHGDDQAVMPTPRGRRPYRTLGSDAHFFIAICTREIAAIQSPGHGVDLAARHLCRFSNGVFQLRIDNIWFCKVLLLFSIDKTTDTGIKMHECAYVSVLEEYKGLRRPGHFYIFCIFCISAIVYIFCILCI